MALKKTYLKSSKICKVTFEFPFEAAIGAKKVVLAGDFNNWDINSNILKKNYKKKVFSTTLMLEPGKKYEYKYYIDDTRWENDWAADSYVQSSVANTENSVVML